MQPILVNLLSYINLNPTFPAVLEKTIYQVILGVAGGYHLFSKISNAAKKRFQSIPYITPMIPVIGGLVGIIETIRRPVSTITFYVTLLFIQWMRSGPNIKEESLPSYVIDMTKKAKDDRTILDLGDCKCFEEMEIVLNRTRKNNVVLVGKAGVGKTAQIEYIAKKIANKQVSPSSPFANKRIWVIDLADLMQKTKYIGQLEERMAPILKLAEEKKGIFFIDEIHMVMGAGAGSKSNIDIAGLLKGALARKGISMIGATTPEEYEHLANNPAFARRFQRIDITEPSRDECFKSFQRQIPYFQTYYPKIKLTEKAIAAAIFFAQRDIKDRSIIDATYDWIDNACSYVSLRNSETVTEIDVHTIAQIHKKFSGKVQQFSVEVLERQFNSAMENYSQLLFPSFTPEALPLPV